MGDPALTLAEIKQAMGRWTRIPLRGNPIGIVLLLPDLPLTEDDWTQMMLTLEAMKPGLTWPAEEACADG